MSETYIVSEGDYMELIAQQNGYRDYHTIYDHADNAAYKKLRPNPDILFPSDTLKLPDKDAAAEPADTDKKHKFELKREKVKLQVYIRRNGKPLAKQKYTLKYTLPKSSPVLSGVTTADGLIEQDMPVGTLQVLLTLPGPPEYTRLLNPGYLHPITTVSGIKMRLNNLGFACGSPKSGDAAAYKSALTAFQHHFKLKETGIDDTPTIDKLRDEYEKGRPS